MHRNIIDCGEFFNIIMVKIFVTISSLVIVINIIYIIIPSEKYARYCKVIIGIITMLAIINLFSGDYDLNFDFDFNSNMTATNENANAIFDNLMKKELENKIKSMLVKKYGDVIKGVSIEYLSNEIKSVTIDIYDFEKSNDIKNDVAIFCDIKIERIMVKYV